MILKNSKKIVTISKKNEKFVLQAHFNYGDNVEWFGSTFWTLKLQNIGGSIMEIGRASCRDRVLAIV